ncbi:hypothetical protein N7517_009815 [Penicillium concentricum]|uniref:Uncharacterized protein n=1 Tax=Penicillium concentricum TaxID=293559 RepID=A0A9W9UXU8_9EURO|nr:uncharacterized protein N7517_009815 [Penicillium concentricum]KAJ5360624.1 hypothetical protein N7517_009815 [Penicillium concentricum]
MAFPHRFRWLAKPSPFTTLRQPRLSPAKTGRLVTYDITSEMQCPLFDRLRWCFELDFMCGYQSTWDIQEQTKDGEQSSQVNEDTRR